MKYPIVVILSGPEATRAKTELALEDGRLPIFPPDHYALRHRRSYQAEDWPHLTQTPSGLEPDEPHGFVAVLAANEQAFHTAYRIVEPHDWVLRVHYEMPAEPKPDPVIQKFSVMEQRIAELEARLGALHGV